MLIKIITLKFDPVFEKFDDTEFMDFIKDKDILSAQDHFFIKNSSPYIAVIIQYLPYHTENVLGQVAGKKSDKKSKQSDDSWKKLVLEKDFPLFNFMRDWRLERSKKEGIPPYLICTNKQLAQIIKNRPDSFAELQKISGIGKAKIEKYGKDFLTLLNPQFQSTNSSQQESKHEEPQKKRDESGKESKQQSEKGTA